MTQTVIRSINKLLMRKNKKPVFVYDNDTAMMRKINSNSNSKSSYCASPVIIKEGFKISLSVNGNETVHGTVVKRTVSNNGVLLYVNY